MKRFIQQFIIKNKDNENSNNIIEERKNNSTKIYIFNITTILIGFIGYLLLSYNYVNQKICTKSNSFILLITFYFIAFILIYCRINNIIKFKYVFGKFLNILSFFITAFLAIYIEEITWNTNIANINIVCFLLNYLLALILTGSILLIIRKTWLAYFLVILLNWIYGIVNHYVLEFKGYPPLFNDLMASKTAITVMGNYDYYLSDEIVTGTLIFIFYCIVLMYFMPKSIIFVGNYAKKKLVSLICRITILIILWALILNHHFTTFFK